VKAYLAALEGLIQPVRAADYPPSLEPMRALLAELGDPAAAVPAVVVAGSSGKGTTCTRLAGLLRANGRHVGLYTSPHLHSFRERFVIDDTLIAMDAFSAGAEMIRAAAARLGGRYSTFEQATALALWWFAEQAVDVAVLEVGVGGRFDAVNTVEPVLSVITRIELEHVAMLGGSLESIAWHKAGILRAGCPALTIEQDAAALDVLRAEAEHTGADLRMIPGTLDDLAAAAAAHFGATSSALPITRPPGRLEVVTQGDLRFLIDGGHTPGAGRALADAITQLVGPDAAVRLVIGLLRDKDWRAYLHPLDRPGWHIDLTTAPGHRAAPSDQLAAALGDPAARVTRTPVLTDALAAARVAPADLVVIGGSLRMAAAAREYLGLLPESLLAEARATRALFEGDDYLSRLG
jgi:dihydrofolate synthase/folylpolyglutamate synthase